MSTSKFVECPLVSRIGTDVHHTLFPSILTQHLFAPSLPSDGCVSVLSGAFLLWLSGCSLLSTVFYFKPIGLSLNSLSLPASSCSRGYLKILTVVEDHSTLSHLQMSLSGSVQCLCPILSGKTLNFFWKERFKAIAVLHPSLSHSRIYNT